MKTKSPTTSRASLGENSGNNLHANLHAGLLFLFAVLCAMFIAGTLFAGTLFAGVTGTSFAQCVAFADEATSENTQTQNQAQNESQDESDESSEQKQTTKAQPVYRLYNSITSEHLFATDITEYNTLRAYDWQQEGIAWYSPVTSDVKVYRLYNPALGAMAKMSHHYTSNA